MSENTGAVPREHWGSKIGLILAMAGNAVGLGNFLRFPTQAAQNGGGAFMIPYFIAFFLLGIPLMWIEWGLGRYGGTIGHGTMPGVLQKMVRNKLVKYLGVLGFTLPLFIGAYYCYIESWTLSFSFFSVKGTYISQLEGPAGLENKRGEMGRYLSEFQGIGRSVKIVKSATLDDVKNISNLSDAGMVPPNLLYDPQVHGAWDPTNAKLDPKDCPYVSVDLKKRYFVDNSTAYWFFLMTFALNMFFLFRGLSAGIEKLAKVGMPLLFVFALILAIRVLTLGDTPGAVSTISEGFNFLWTPNFKELYNSKIWLAAAGQIFFTLSLGLGSIQAYASYLSDRDDIVLTGLATASTNEFAEVVLGSSIAIPAAVAFFGAEGTMAIARGGSFDLGFQSMPMIFSQLDMGWFFGALWFILLFIAGITSSVALLTPAISFLKDEAGLSHHKAVLAIGITTFILAHGPIFWLKNGVLDEMDYWAGTFGLVVVACFEVFVFMWVFGAKRAWLELHKGCDIRIPDFFQFIMKYVTPFFITAILVVWSYQEGWAKLTMAGTPVADQPYVWATRFVMLLVIGIFMLLIWKRFKDEDQESIAVPLAIWGFPMLVLVATYPGLIQIETSGLILLVCSWTVAFGLVGYSIAKMLMLPPRKDDRFIEDHEA
ncbi:MAG: sodium:calcium symporter [Candidatus Rifleibacteriota bacterium]